MKRTNLILAVLCAVALVASVLTYVAGVSRGDRFERGRKLLPNLNPDDIATIVLTRGAGKGAETVTLEREDDRFTVAEVHGYPAKTEAVNRLLRDVLDLSLEQEVGEGEDLAAELGIDPPGEDTLEVTFENAAGEEMVRLRVGDRLAGGEGNYVQRMDGESPIYLTSKAVLLTTGADELLDKRIVNVPASDLRRIQGPDFTLEKGEDGSLALIEVPPGRREKASATGKVKSALSYLSFEEVYPADDPAVRGLELEERLRVELNDGTGYVLRTASDGEAEYLAIAGFSTIDRVEFSQETSEEELQEKAESLSRAEEIQGFNDFHGSWVYRISDAVAEKLALTAADLVEPAGG